MNSLPPSIFISVHAQYVKLNHRPYTNIYSPGLKLLGIIRILRETHLKSIDRYRTEFHMKLNITVFLPVIESLSRVLQDIPKHITLFSHSLTILTWIYSTQDNTYFISKRVWICVALQWLTEDVVIFNFVRNILKCCTFFTNSIWHHIMTLVWKIFLTFVTIISRLF